MNRYSHTEKMAIRDVIDVIEARKQRIRDREAKLDQARCDEAVRLFNYGSALNDVLVEVYAMLEANHGEG